MNVRKAGICLPSVHSAIMTHPKQAKWNSGDPARPTWRLKEITDEVFKYFYK